MVENLDLALRVRADMRQALAQTRGLQAAVRRTGTAAQRAGRGVRAFGRAWRDASADLQRTQRRLLGVRSLIAGLGVGLAIRGIVRATGEQEQALAAVADGIRRLGDETTLTTAGLQEMAAGLQQVTTFGDETILRLQSLLLTFRNIDGSQFERVTEAALDMATAIGQQPRDAALQLAKALEDPIQGLTALRRSGTVFSAAQTDVIRKLHETGRAAEAQSLILDELERQYGGAARAARDTLAGSLAALRNAFGDLFEVAEDGTSAVREAVEELILTLQDPAVREGFQALARGALSAIGGIANALAQLNLQVQGDDSPLARLRSLILELEGGFLFREIQFPNVWDSLLSDEALREAIADVLPDLAAAGEQLSAPLVGKLRELGIDIEGAIAGPLQREIDAANQVVIRSSRELQDTIANIREQQGDLPFIVGEESREAANAALSSQLARAEQLQKTIADAEARIRDLNEEIAIALSRVPSAEEEAEAPAAPAPAPLADLETRTRTEIRAGERLVDIRRRTERRLLGITRGALAQLERDHAEAHERIRRLEVESGDTEAANAARLAQDELYYAQREQLLQEHLDAEEERKAEAAKRDRERREAEQRQLEAEQEHIARLLRDPQEAYRRDVAILQRLVREGAQAESPFAEAARDAAVYGDSVEDSVGRAFERATEDVRAFVVEASRELEALARDTERHFGRFPSIRLNEEPFVGALPDNRQFPVLRIPELESFLDEMARIGRSRGSVIGPEATDRLSLYNRGIRERDRLIQEHGADVLPRIRGLPPGVARLISDSGETTEEYLRGLQERLDAIDAKAAEQIEAIKGGDTVLQPGDAGFLTPDSFREILERSQRDLFRGFREVAERGYVPPAGDQSQLTPDGVARLLQEQEDRRQATADSLAAREAERLRAREDAKEAAREEYFRRQAEEERSQFNVRREAQELIREALEGLGGQLRIDPDLGGLPGVGRGGAPAEQDFPGPDMERLEQELQRQIRELIDGHQRYIDNLQDLGAGGDAVPGFRPAALRETADAVDDVALAVQQIEVAQTAEEFRAFLETLSLTPQQTERAVAAFESLRLAYLDTQTTLEAGFERGLLRYSSSAADLADVAETAVVGSLRGMEDALVQFVSTGKVDFKSLADSIIADLARIAIQQSIIGPLAGALFGGGGGFGLGSLFGVGHGGGIAGSLGRRRAVNPLVFAGAPRFHAGGIAGDEVPIIARRGEGVFTPEQMRALGGGGPRQVRVDIRNEGQPQQVSDADASFDLDGMVISIVTRDLAAGGDTARAIEAIVPGAQL